VVHDDGRIVARPLDKFFNLDEHPSTRREALPEGALEVTDKLDGSLVILRDDPDGIAASTRGSFLSEQALWATAWLRARGTPRLEEDLTVCAEFISPRNRIVLDYGAREEVVVLAARRVSDGRELQRPELERVADRLGLSLVPQRQVSSLQALLQEAEGALGIEGFVARWPHGVRAKVKTPEYRRIHRQRCYLTPELVRDALAAGGLDGLMMEMPEEIWPEIRGMAAEIEARVARVTEVARRKHAELAERSGPSRKVYASFAKREPEAKFLFLLLDGREVRGEVLRTVDLSGMQRVWTTFNRPPLAPQ
jgi:RNA ligase